jgi:SWI/SNF-related matrix-associated actin-dependent regulator 1 of chromatin subfamily A
MKPLMRHQTAALNFFNKTKRCFVALDMGMGKTRVAIEAMPSDKRTLIICPSIAKIHWMREIEKWRPELSGSVQIIHKRKTVVDKSMQVHIITFNILVSKVTPKKNELFKPWFVVIDEVHNCKTLKAKQSLRAMKMMRESKRCALLTGTPMPNRPMELYPVLKSLEIVPADKHAFGMTYCRGFMNKHTGQWDYRGASRLEELSNMLAPIMFHRTKADISEHVPGRLDPRVLELDMPVDIREKKLDTTEIEKNSNPLAFETISEIMRESGLRKIPYVVDHIKEVLESEAKCVVFAHHRDVIQELERQLAEFFPVVVMGGTQNKQAQVDRFHHIPTHAKEHGPSRVFIGQTKAAGVVIDLTCASYVIFAEGTWVPGDLDQCISRCDRMGQTEVVRTDILTIHKSIDAHMLHAVIRKMEDINAVIKETEMSKRKTIEELVRDQLEYGAELRNTSIEEYIQKLGFFTDVEWEEEDEPEEIELEEDEPEEDEPEEEMADPEEEEEEAEEEAETFDINDVKERSERTCFSSSIRCT